MSRIRLGGLLGAAVATQHLLLSFAPAPAMASVPHTVLRGETLWSIAAANNFTTRTVATFNGLSEDAYVYAGETIQIPTEAEGAAALAAAPPAATSPAPVASGSAVLHAVQPGESLWSIATANGISEPSLASYNGLSPDAHLIIGQTIQVPTSGGSVVSATGVSLGTIPSPFGDVYLRSDAAAAWNSMRQASLDTYGVDLYPGGALSAYRTYEQQADLYQAYLDGTGAAANPPGSSSHELGTAVDVETPEMRSVIDAIGSSYGWTKVHGPDEWWHVDYVG